jgi:tetratricopeptide (TPR) repeat protein
LKALIKTISFSLLLLILSVSCSRKKNNFLTRNFHAITTEYNVLFNGFEAFEVGKAQVNQAFFDDFFELLPVERIQINDDGLFFTTGKRNPNFVYAEEKAVKAVQKHSITEGGLEYNPQIDEAYLLLGEARYFDQRFIPAIDAFNYLINEYPNSDKVNTAKIWLAKTNFRLENIDLAMSQLQEIIALELEPADRAEASAALAQAFIVEEDYSAAINHLKTARVLLKDKVKKGRYTYIIGQLYDKLGQTDSASVAFEEVIKMNRKIPRDYHINAHMQRIKYRAGTKADEDFEKYLKKLEKNRENRPYLDRIFNQIGDFHLSNADDSLAIKFYNKSLAANKRNKKITARNYNQLADMAFDNSEYLRAGAYFDSTLTQLNPKSKAYRILKRKRDNLADLILYENQIRRNDSILSLVAMTDTQKLSYFEIYTDSLKADFEAKQAAANAEVERNVITSGAMLRKSQAGRQSSGPFYFYNSQTVENGKKEFQKIWGNRSYQNNWRWSSSDDNSVDNKAENETQESIATENELFDPQFYISKIPSDQTIIDSIKQERDLGYYKLGFIYKNKLSENDLSIEKFDDLLSFNPDEELVVPSKYNLYKIYQDKEEFETAEALKQDIINNYPNTRYAAILLNPNVALESDENSAEKTFGRLYKLHENENYQTVIEGCKKAIIQFDDDPIVPKFEFLKAKASGRLYGFKAYEEQVKFIALNYADTPQGAYAQRLIDEVFPNLAKTEFTADDTSQNNKAVYIFNKPFDNTVMESFKKQIDSVNIRLGYKDLRTSVEFYDKTTTFVIINGLKSKLGAEGYVSLLKDDHKIEHEPNFAISQDNYELVQRHKILDAYLSKEIK